MVRLGRLTPLVEVEWWSRSITKVLALCLWNGVILQDDEKGAKNDHSFLERESLYVFEMQYILPLSFLN